MHLSPREYQIVRLAALGLNDKTIAATLVLDPTTVMWYFNRLMKKCNLSSRFQLIAVLTANGAIPASDILMAAFCTQKQHEIDGEKTKNVIELANIPIK